LTRYRLDPEYLEQIKKSKCPYCTYPLRKPYPKKRVCTSCDFIHLGDPKLTAFTIIEPEISYRFDINHCVECVEIVDGKEKKIPLVYDRDTKELICPKCGLLHTGPPIHGIIYPFGSHTNSNFLLLR